MQSLDLLYPSVNEFRFVEITEAVVQKCSVKKVFLKMSQNSQENIRVRVLRPPTLLKKRFWHRCFPVNFAKFLRTPFLQNTSDGCF